MIGDEALAQLAKTLGASVQTHRIPHQLTTEFSVRLRPSMCRAFYLTDNTLEGVIEPADILVHNIQRCTALLRGDVIRELCDDDVPVDFLGVDAIDRAQHLERLGEELLELAHTPGAGAAFRRVI